MPSVPSPGTSLSAAHLRIDGVSRTLAGRRVLTDVSFVVGAGERVGLIGQNGSGKSTLLRIAAGLLEPDAGAVRASAPSDGSPRVGLLHQEPPFAPDLTVQEAVEAALAPARQAVAVVEAAARRLAADPAAADEYSHALAQAERIGAWDVDRRATTMLAGLGLADLPVDRRTAHLSGGQRARLSLAWLLLHAPDVLLLDEPSNHLDDAALDHLSEVLRGWPGPVLLASHDRVLLDETATALVDLDPGPIARAVARPALDDGPGSGIGVNRFTGTYSDYLHARTLARQRWERRYRDEQAELARLRSAVRDNHQVGHEVFTPRTEGKAAAKFYADRNARVVARRVNSSRSQLEELTRTQVSRPPGQLRFTLPARPDPGEHLSTGPGAEVLTAQVAVPGRLAAVGLRLESRDRLLVIGPNGAGKSTLLQVLAGQLDGQLAGPPDGPPDRHREAKPAGAPAGQPDAEPTGSHDRQPVAWMDGPSGTGADRPWVGTVWVRPGLRVGLLAQEVDLPDPHRRGPARTVGRAYADLVGEDLADRTPLRALGLIEPRDEYRPVEALSLGQQRRLALACLLADPPEILLLDEPTNHLSLLLVEDLEAAIADYPGAVVLASHDRRLGGRWTGRRLQL